MDDCTFSPLPHNTVFSLRIEQCNNVLNYNHKLLLSYCLIVIHDPLCNYRRGNVVDTLHMLYILRKFGVDVSLIVSKSHLESFNTTWNIWQFNSDIAWNNDLIDSNIVSVPSLNTQNHLHDSTDNVKFSLVMLCRTLFIYNQILPTNSESQSLFYFLCVSFKGNFSVVFWLFVVNSWVKVKFLR